MIALYPRERAAPTAWQAAAPHAGSHGGYRLNCRNAPSNGSRYETRQSFNAVPHPDLDSAIFSAPVLRVIGSHGKSRGEIHDVI